MPSLREETRDDAQWQLAVDDVAAMIIHEEVAKALIGNRDDLPDERYCAIVRAVIYSRTATAKAAWAAGHPTHPGRCVCRQEALIIVNATQQARISGESYTDLVMRGLTGLQTFLRNRN